MPQIRALIPLLIAAGILIGGNGMQGTYIPLRGAYEGFSVTLIGIIGAGYSLGFAIGCIYITRLLRAIGHIRLFAALAAIAASASLSMALLIDPVFWFLMRFLTGICVAGLFATVESWINAKVTNQTRARTLSIYRFVDLFSVTAGQYLIPVAGIPGFAAFAVISMATTLSLVPISIADKSSPAPPGAVKFDVRTIWQVSPLAVVGVVVVGLTMAAFRYVGPLYASNVGFSVAEVASFMSAGIIGGVVLQYPLGHFSDRIDRRKILLVTTAGALIAGLYLAIGAGNSEWRNIAGVFIFGAFAMPLYSLCSAHANDFAKDGQHASIAAGLLFFWSVGATIGPFLASVMLQFFGPHALFWYTSVIQAAFIGYTVYRMSARAAIPAGERRSRFRALLRTSLYFSKLATPPAERDGGRKSGPSD
jgi:MFS family permease